MSARMLAIMLVAALVLAACGTDEDAADDTAATTPTPTDTDAPADATDVDTEVPAEAEPVVQAVDNTVAEGSAAFVAEVVIDSAEFSDRMESSGVVDFDGDRRQIDLGTDAGDVRAIVTADGVLLSLGDDAGWVRADPSELRGTPLEAYGLASLPLQDPSVNLGLLRGATEDVREVGEEDLDGESTTRYEVTVDVERAAAQADGVTAEQIRAAGGQGETVGMDVWIDDADRIRRIMHRTDLSQTDLVQTPEGPEAAIEVQLDLTDFGVPVTIDEPDEGEIVDVDEQTLEQLLRQLTGDEGMTMGGSGSGSGTDADADTGTDDGTDTQTDADDGTDAEDTQGVDDTDDDTDA
jgi:hypothetical protein